MYLSEQIGLSKNSRGKQTATGIINKLIELGLIEKVKEKHDNQFILIS